MGFIDRVRSLPLATRRMLVGVIVVVLAVIGLGLWLVTGFGNGSSGDNLRAISDGAGSVAELIQGQTDKYADTKAELENNLSQVLKSSALILPESLADVREEPDGVLFLQHEHRSNGTKTVLEDVTFYPSYTLVRATITNESEAAQFIEAGHGSVIEQASAGSKLSAQPIFQAGTPTTVEPGQSIEAQIVFGPLNGRLPFTVVIGDFVLAADTDPNAKTWSARFEVDPSKIVDETPAENSTQTSP